MLDPAQRMYWHSVQENLHRLIAFLWPPPEWDTAPLPSQLLQLKKQSRASQRQRLWTTVDSKLSYPGNPPALHCMPTVEIQSCSVLCCAELCSAYSSFYNCATAPARITKVMTKYSCLFSPPYSLLQAELDFILTHNSHGLRVAGYRVH